VTNTATKTDSLVKRKGKGKVFPLQAWTGPWDPEG
jgi:hypothetical protein